MNDKTPHWETVRGAFGEGSAHRPTVVRYAYEKMQANRLTTKLANSVKQAATDILADAEWACPGRITNEDVAAVLQHLAEAYYHGDQSTPNTSY